MAYLVVGGGTVGTYLASTLSKNGGRVLLKTRNAPRREAALVAAKAGVEVINSIEPLADRLCSGDLPQLEAIFLATKTYSLREAIGQLSVGGEMMRPRLATIGCYNGHVMGVERMIEQAVGGAYAKSLVPGGYTFKPDGSGFEVTNASQKWSLLSKSAEVRELSARMSALGVATVAGGFEADTRKYLVNTTANLVSVIANTNCHGLVSDSALLLRMRNIYREASAVLRASPLHAPHMPGDVTDEELEDQVLSGIASYGAHYPSSCQDFRAGRPIEVESLNGYIVAIGQQIGIPTPFNQAVVDDIAIVLRRADSLLSDSLKTPPPPPPTGNDLLSSLRGSRSGVPVHQAGASTGNARGDAPAQRPNVLPPPRVSPLVDISVAH
jgi:2-dehydropantoate 2-reductase